MDLADALPPALGSALLCLHRAEFSLGWSQSQKTEANECEQRAPAVWEEGKHTCRCGTASHTERRILVVLSPSELMLSVCGAVFLPEKQ